MGVDEQVQALGIDLRRTLARPKGVYVNATTVGTMVYLAGHGPFQDGVPRYQGRVPTAVSVEEAVEAAHLTALNCLSTLQHHLGSLDRVERIVDVLGMVNAEPGFADHPTVIDGASRLFVEIFGDRGLHTRAAVGFSSLPFDIPVEITLTAVARSTG